MPWPKSKAAIAVHPAPTAMKSARSHKRANGCGHAPPAAAGSRQANRSDRQTSRAPNETTFGSVRGAPGAHLTALPDKACNVYALPPQNRHFAARMRLFLPRAHAEPLLRRVCKARTCPRVRTVPRQKVRTAEPDRCPKLTASPPLHTLRAMPLRGGAAIRSAGRLMLKRAAVRPTNAAVVRAT